MQLIPDRLIKQRVGRDPLALAVQVDHGIVEPTGHPDPPAAAIPHHQGLAAAVIQEVQDPVSGLLPVVEDLQVLSPVVEEDPEVVAPAVVDQEVEEETNIFEADYLIQIITKNGKVV